MKYADWYEEIGFGEDYDTVHENFACADDEISALQAKIDELMLEYCPEEMSEEQLENWAGNQKPLNKDEQHD